MCNIERKARFSYTGTCRKDYKVTVLQTCRRSIKSRKARFNTRNLTATLFKLVKHCKVCFYNLTDMCKALSSSLLRYSEYELFALINNIGSRFLILHTHIHNLTCRLDKVSKHLFLLRNLYILRKIFLCENALCNFCYIGNSAHTVKLIAESFRKSNHINGDTLFKKMAYRYKYCLVCSCVKAVLVKLVHSHNKCLFIKYHITEDCRLCFKIIWHSSSNRNIHLYHRISILFGVYNHFYRS